VVDIGWSTNTERIYNPEACRINGKSRLHGFAPRYDFVASNSSFARNIRRPDTPEQCFHVETVSSSPMMIAHCLSGGESLTFGVTIHARPKLEYLAEVGTIPSISRGSNLGTQGRLHCSYDTLSIIKYNISRVKNARLE
jgi:hypothetical protein